ncbi:hypothetical protein WDZ17_09205 [Pseudokineococcus basanitobsidens]|uniref:Phospholipase A2-like protein n=1 Tax=Pseudokineococcus basanitobsidens TaxID=1926649 RepID=A0ABU8RK50_9ACTN
MSTSGPDPWASPTPSAGDARAARPAPSEAPGAHRDDAWAPVWATGGGSAPPPPPRRRRWPVVVAVVVASVVLVGGVVALAVTGVRSGWDALAGGGSDFFGVEEGEAYGDNPVLDEMWDGCEAGDGTACDDLYDSSGLGTDYEDFGYTCGERFTEASTPDFCVDEMGGDGRGAVADVREGSRYGDDAVLDRLWDGCEAGDGVDCDELYGSSEEGSDYAEFGVTCGERYSAVRAPEFCADALR